MKKTPQQYGWLIAELNKAGNIPMLVAGQAVNAWCEIFQEWDKKHNKQIKPNLEDLRPFTSGDMELMKINITALEQAGEITQKTIHDPFDRCAPADHSIWGFKDSNGEEYFVQIMNRLMGTTKTELAKHTLKIELEGGGIVELPDPIALLPGKITNLLQLDQKGRQDLRHCQMLACCTLAFLGTNCENPEIPARKILNDLERFYLLTKTPAAKKVESQYNIIWENCYPIRQLTGRAQSDEKLRNWLQHQNHRRGKTKPPPPSNQMER